MNNVSQDKKGRGTTVTNYHISLVNPEVSVKLGKWSKVIDTSQGVLDNITRARRRRGPAIYRAAWGPGAAELWGFTL